MHKYQCYLFAAMLIIVGLSESPVWCGYLETAQLVATVLEPRSDGAHQSSLHAVCNACVENELIV